MSAVGSIFSSGIIEVVVPPATTGLPIKETMAFDRKDYGMNKGIPLVKIADRVEVTVNLIGKRVSGHSGGL